MKKNKAIGVVVAIALFLGLLTYTTAVGFGPTGTGAAKNITLGLDLSGGVSITYEVVGDENPSAEDMKDTIYKLQQRVDGYSTEAQVYQEGTNRINIEIPGVSDANTILEELGKPGSLQFQLEDGTVVVDGSQVASAEAGVQQDNLKNNENVVKLEFDSAGAAAFATATSENIGKSIYIVYDGDVISAPTVQSADHRRFCCHHRHGRCTGSRKSGFFHPYRFSVPGTAGAAFQRCRCPAWGSRNFHQLKSRSDRSGTCLHLYDGCLPAARCCCSDLSAAVHRTDTGYFKCI